MSRISRQKSCPSRSRADSLRSETVRTSADDARAASARIAGEGYCDVPSRRREARVTPYRVKSGVWVNATVFRRSTAAVIARSRRAFGRTLVFRQALATKQSRSRQELRVPLDCSAYA